jgi:transcriptional regulator with XRE-family HTH domain
MSDAARLLRDARRHAGLTQAELAARLNTTQPAVAKLERSGANPTVETLDRAVAATGHRLQLIAPAFGDGADVSLLRQALRSSPQQRLESLQSLVRLGRVAEAATNGRGEPA